MAYYTCYTLIARKIKSKSQFEQINDFLRQRDIINYALCPGEYACDKHEALFETYELARWNNHSEDMVHVAEKFPNVYFMLEGAGEEHGDYWREYYHDMDIEQCRGEVIYEEPKKVQWNELIPF